MLHVTTEIGKPGKKGKLTNVFKTTLSVIGLLIRYGPNYYRSIYIYAKAF